jgi:response regulator RpfG family c-di-GMP phosphodiesterase
LTCASLRKRPFKAGPRRADGSCMFGEGEEQVPRRRRVLVIDDDPAMCAMLRASLELEGLEVAEAHNVIESENVLIGSAPDAIVLDIGLPGVDGVFYCERLREAPRTRAIPIVAISGSEEAGACAKAAGANAFLAKPLDPIHLVTTLGELFGTAPLEHALRDEEPAGAEEIRRLIQIGQRQQDLLIEAYRRTLGALADALESRDFATGQHSRRVASYATRLSIEVEPSLVDDPTLEWGFLLHDVGKIAIPDHVLLKRGSLNRRERALMEQHTVLGERLVENVPLLRGEGIRVVRSHHEHWDGRGYPDGTVGSDTPLAARVFAVADALDAMTDLRPYRSPISWDDAVEEIEEGRGRQFDPDAVDALVACERDLHAVYLEARPVAA